jgi:hypothetical protein
MSKPSDDLSALFRSLRPDESAFKENISSGVRDAEQRWPLFKTVAPQKPQDPPALSEQERQHWKSQEKSAASARKPALSLPALSDKMSKGLGKISEQAVRNIAAVRPAVRWESPEHIAEGAAGHSALQTSEQPRTASAEPAPLTSKPVNRAPMAVKALPEVLATGGRTGVDLFDKKPAPTAPALMSVQSAQMLKIPEMSAHDAPAAGRSDESLKSIFSRLEAKPEVEVKPAVKRSSFLDRLGKR